jgi:hypothetical protein
MKTYCESGEKFVMGRTFGLRLNRQFKRGGDKTISIDPVYAYCKDGAVTLKSAKLQRSSRQRHIRTDDFSVGAFPLPTKGPGQKPNVFRPRLAKAAANARISAAAEILVFY